jgi:flagellin
VSAALSALASVQAAISTVASMAAGVGAFQNELQGIAANLTVMNQNLTAAKSQLVDVNFAQATTQFSTEQILMQSGTAMLSQAQQQPALVLKLLT